MNTKYRWMMVNGWYSKYWFNQEYLVGIARKDTAGPPTLMQCVAKKTRFCGPVVWQVVVSPAKLRVFIHILAMLVQVCSSPTTRLLFRRLKSDQGYRTVHRTTWHLPSRLPRPDEARHSKKVANKKFQAQIIELLGCESDPKSHALSLHPSRSRLVIENGGKQLNNCPKS